MNDVLATDAGLGGETVIEYKMITHDHKGLALLRPELGISVNGSELVPVAQIISTAASINGKPDMFDWANIDTSGAIKLDDKHLLINIMGLDHYHIGGWGLTAELCKRFAAYAQIEIGDVKRYFKGKR